MTESGKNYFFWNEKAFEEKVREVVCPHCPHAGFTLDDCRNPDPRGCAVFRYLPDLVRIAQHMGEPSFEDYVEEVGNRMKFDCKSPASAPHTCDLLDSPQCGLNRLLPFVLEAVMQTDKALEARPGFSA